jgi:hypothetical protein
MPKELSRKPVPLNVFLAQELLTCGANALTTEMKD